MDSFPHAKLEFAQEPPEFLHLTCPLCKSVLENAHLISCCAQHICGACAQKLAGSTCTLCGAEFEKVPDKRHQKAIDCVVVLCTNKQGGCEWSGELKELRSHLYEEGGCEYALFPCRYKCGEVLPPTEKAEHEENACLERPATCSHCGSYSSTWRDVNEKHASECPEAPVACCNGCGQTVTRQSLRAHLDTCGLQPVECEFAYAGCTFKPERCAVDQHNEDQWRHHMTLITAYNSKRIENLTHQLSALSDRLLSIEERQSLNRDDDNVSVDELSDGSSGASSSSVVREVVPSLKTNSTLSQSGHPFRFLVTRFAQKKEGNATFTSRKFYYGNPGYAFKACVHPNGLKEGFNTHVAVFLSIIPGRKDSRLKWPFEGILTVRLCDQSRGQKHYEKVFDFKQAPLTFSQQPHGWVSEGFGFNAFIPHKMLQPRYLLNNRLVFEVLEVILPTRHAHASYY